MPSFRIWRGSTRMTPRSVRCKVMGLEENVGRRSRPSGDWAHLHGENALRKYRDLVRALGELVAQLALQQEEQERGG